MPYNLSRILIGMVQTKHTVLQTKAYMPYNLSRILHRDGSKNTHSTSNKSLHALNGSKNTHSISKN